VRRLTRKVVEEMRSHSLLTLVEATGFVPTWKSCTPGDVMEQLTAAIAPGEEGDAPIEIERPVPKKPFVTDVALLVRVLVNMVRNALEAAPQGPIRIECRRVGETYRFSVNNPGVIPDDVAAWIFTRSFSTKAAQGRGLGTYSMKLFGERVLGGRVGFTSDAGSGTTFFIEHPVARRAG
jgi:signal transduction histidine kinase